MKKKAKESKQSLLAELAIEIYDDLAAKMVVALYRERDRVRKQYGHIFPKPPRKSKGK